VGAMIIAAFLTPPDPVSQLMIAVPLVFLYQFAIYLSKIAQRKRKRDLERAFSGEDG
jgi:sec-independent protein translocase protein TatC